jgi:catechol 2,3-dioxygenase-like lactoylglutathione lyase family enzyme
MPRISNLKETALYVDDVDRAVRFYRDVLGLPILVQDERFCALDVNSQNVLLLFLRGASNQTTTLPGGQIPPHDGDGSIHAGFAIEAAEIEAWEMHLAAHSVEVLSRMEWPRGGRSLYFRDPDGHLIELLTPGVWATY